MAAVALLLAAPHAIASTEIAAMWSRIYRSAVNIDQKFAVMQNIVDEDDRALVPTFGDALQDLISIERNPMTSLERTVYNDLLQLILGELGDLRATDTAPFVWDVVGFSEDLFTRAAAIEALGKMGARDYSDEIARILRNLNFNQAPTVNRPLLVGTERLARKSVVALGRLKDEVGFLPAFFASIGWYSAERKVKDRAREAMRQMVDDPTELLLGLLRDDADFTVKLAALEAEDVSRAPNSGKIQVAVAALEQGLIHEPINVREGVVMSQLRLKAAQMMVVYESSAPEAVRHLERAIYADYDINERLAEIEALRVHNTDEAVRVLTTYLSEQNRRNREGLAPRDYRTIRATIRALGEMGSIIPREDLTMVRFSGWTPAVDELAAEALSKIDAAQ